MKLKNQNKQTLLDYAFYLKENKGRVLKTIDDALQTLSLWDEIFPNTDFREFNSDKAIEIVETFRNRKRTDGKNIVLSSVFHKINVFMNYFSWLSERDGYKSKIKAGDIRLLRLNDNELNAIKTHKPRKTTPTLKEIGYIIKNIPPETEVNRRDRALIALLAMTGIRNEAIETLPLGAYDERRRAIYQNPSEGVKTKRRKFILTVPIIFDQMLFDIFEEWINFLKIEKGFSDDDPMFPQTEKVHRAGTYCYSGDYVGKRFWKSTTSLETILKRRCKEAGQIYFKPHSFRDFIVEEIRNWLLTPLQVKAISMSLGHTYVSTTFDSYGNQDDSVLISAIQSINIQWMRNFASKQGELIQSKNLSINKDDLIKIIEEVLDKIGGYTNEKN